MNDSPGKWWYLYAVVWACIISHWFILGPFDMFFSVLIPLWACCFGMQVGWWMQARQTWARNEIARLSESGGVS